MSTSAPIKRVIEIPIEEPSIKLLPEATPAPDFAPIKKDTEVEVGVKK